MSKFEQNKNKNKKKKKKNTNSSEHNNSYHERQEEQLSFASSRPLISSSSLQLLLFLVVRQFGIFVLLVVFLPLGGVLFCPLFWHKLVGCWPCWDCGGFFLGVDIFCFLFFFVFFFFCFLFLKGLEKFEKKKRRLHQTKLNVLFTKMYLYVKIIKTSPSCSKNS